ncbi:RNA polymerase sigma factor SigF [Streptomyces sp. NBC_01803]|uniref:RNA polymerase sigma factor SigF n=1 Tax=Streptomyces sp. NBC_01803 TaxID=2975946 RepID=UPI002DD87577|nr:RNA polymerase sigma factor SigF [Streptomyces sp. NBC_01803]WSA47663.1 RNA polymerase sigma factor SigF [Streptomyces sp. NBC_01803]
MPLPHVPDAGKIAPRDARELTKLFLSRLSVLEEGTREYQYARNTLIEINLSLVNFVAGRFRNRAEQMEDILQVGTIGLIKAIDRFDLSREVEFTSFAVPYISGEIKRFFRDTSWAVHVPRRLQELRVDMAKASDELSSRLGRLPTTKELADLLDLSLEEVVEARMACNGYTASSLDAPGGDDSGGSDTARPWAERLGSVDADLEKVENLHALKPFLRKLGERDRRILRMRFGEELTQAQIAAELGISQMHVSRLLSRVLTRLREHLLTQH